MIIHDFEQYSKDWYKIRLGLPTASSARRVVTTTGKLSASIEPYAHELAMEVYKSSLDDEFYGTRYTERGKELEPDAIAAYNMINDVEVDTCGFITNDEGTIGISPDGLVGNYGLVEVKCLADVKHSAMITAWDKTGKVPSDRIAQTQMQLMVSKRKWNDIVFFHPELPFLSIRVEPDLEFQKSLGEGLELLIKTRDEIVESLRRKDGI